MRKYLLGWVANPGWYRGRMIRDGAGHPPGVPTGGTLGGGGNNSGGDGAGNSDGGASGDGESNNTGDTFDAASFWNGPAPADGTAPSGESAGEGSGESGTEGGRGQFATQLTERLNGLSFGDPIFNEEIAGQINDGNYTGIQERFTAMGQQIVRESLAMQVQILRPFAEQLLEQIRSESQQTFTARDNTESLERLFPAAKNPVMAKTIRPIYDQALKNAKGNREAAVDQTKEMLRFMAGESAADLNIDVAPRGSGDRGGPTPNFNWLDELTGRK